MAYNKYTWENGVSPANATNMNHIEQGIYNNSIRVEDIGDLSNLETNDKSTIVGAINEVNASLDEKQDAFIIEEVTLASSITISSGDAIVYTVPAKTGYTAYVLKPYVTGDWSDKYAVYVPWSRVNTIGIRNDGSSSYTWGIYCSVLYIKNEE